MPAGLNTDVTHSNPYPTVGPGRHEAGRDCDTNGGIAFIYDSKESIACHAVETHRFPEDRPIIPGVPPTSPHGEGGRLS